MCAKKGRPTKDEAKLSKSINLKLTEADYVKICENAVSIGLKPTQYARQMALHGEIKSRFTTEELEYMRKLAGMANNLNQLTKRANTDGCRRIEAEAMFLLGQIRIVIDDSKKH